MQYTRLYDHVLSELEYGRTEIGINLLVGMLDVAELRLNHIGQAREELRGHPLHTMLLEDPLCADASQPRRDPVHRVNLLKSQGCDAAVSSTGRRLFAATSEITFARALRQRREEAERKLHSAWRMGQKIWLIADPQCALLETLGAVDTANVFVSSEQHIRLIKAQQVSAGSTFDLILAPHLPDLLSGRSLRKATAWLGEYLGSEGVLATSFLMPGHPGTGWRRTCFNWEPNCHDETAVARLATPGFAAQSYHDEAGCIAWIEMRRA